MVAVVLLSTCRYILKVLQPGNRVFARLALQYKQICLQTLREEVSGLSAGSAPVGAMTVAKALALALDEVGEPREVGGTAGTVVLSGLVFCFLADQLFPHYR